MSSVFKSARHCPPPSASVRAANRPPRLSSERGRPAPTVSAGGRVSHLPSRFPLRAQQSLPAIDQESAPRRTLADDPVRVGLHGKAG